MTIYNVRLKTQTTMFNRVNGCVVSAGSAAAARTAAAAMFSSPADDAAWAEADAVAVTDSGTGTQVELIVSFYDGTNTKVVRATGTTIDTAAQAILAALGTALGGTGVPTYNTSTNVINIPSTQNAGAFVFGGTMVGPTSPTFASDAVSGTAATARNLTLGGTDPAAGTTGTPVPCTFPQPLS